MVGVPELVILFVLVLSWGVPVAAAIWALATLKGLRAGQQAVQLKLDTIERLLNSR